MIRRLAGLVGLVLALAAAPPAVRADTDCAQQHRRVRRPDGFADGRLSFVGIRGHGQSRVGTDFPGNDLRELRIVATWTALAPARTTPPMPPGPSSTPGSTASGAWSCFSTTRTLRSPAAGSC